MKRVDHGHFPGSPKRFLNTRPHVFVPFGHQCFMILMYPRILDQRAAAGAGIAMMFGQMQLHSVERDAYIGRRVRLELMLKIDAETQPVHITFDRFGAVENADYRDGPA